jgi:enoyl-CoA hydratase/carnithine racemase
LKGLVETLTTANSDRSLRAIVLTGAGEKAFAPAPT